MIDLLPFVFYQGKLPQSVVLLTLRLRCTVNLTLTFQSLALSSDVAGGGGSKSVPQESDRLVISKPSGKR